MQLNTKKILITGGSGGLGFSLATLLLPKVETIYIVGKNPKKLQDALSELQSPKVKGVVCDITNSDDVTKNISSLDVDVVINNAGVWIGGSLESNELSAISYAVDVNIKGVLYVTHSVLPQLIKKKEGMIINISSTSGIAAKPLQSVYAATKFAVQGFTDSLAIDLLPHNIHVLGFYPGGMKTNFFAHAGDAKDTSKWVDPIKMAEIIVFMMERDTSLMMNRVVVSRTNG